MQWLGFDWQHNGTAHRYQASDYFDFMYRCAEYLIQENLAYVDEQSAEDMRVNRGDFNTPGKDSPYRTRTVEENLSRFRAMRAGELPEGAAVLRTKIDMASPNINLRDPAIYRIRHATHHHTGDTWWHLSDVYLCAPHRRMRLKTSHTVFAPWNSRINARSTTGCWPKLASGWIDQYACAQAIRVARLNLTYVVTSKRKLAQLVNENHVDGWDDPRMPTIVGLRRPRLHP